MCESRLSYAISKIAFMFFFVLIISVYNYILPLTLFGTILEESFFNISSENAYLLECLNISPKTNVFDFYEAVPDVKSCLHKQPITSVLFNENSRNYVLHINESAIPIFGTNESLSCCFHSMSNLPNEDMQYNEQNCTKFTQDYQLPSDVDGVQISCKSNITKIEIQRDFHWLIPERERIQNRLNSFGTTNKIIRPASILLVGVDSISLLGMHAAMPKTRLILSYTSWFRLYGYHKVKNNTFSNLMTILRGFNMPFSTYWQYRPQKSGFIWKYFHNSGYVTAFVEEDNVRKENKINTTIFGESQETFIDYHLNFYNSDFNKYVVNKTKSSNNICIEQRHSVQHLFDYAIELGTRYRKKPYFGLFWSKSRSQNPLYDVLLMDTLLSDFLNNLKLHNIFDDSIVILFSAHDSIFKEKFLDDKLPLFFIWLPTWFRKLHPAFVRTLNHNQSRLTDAYNINETLKHILMLARRTPHLNKFLNCPVCKSVFLPVALINNCNDISVDKELCKCFRPLYPN